MLFSGTRLYSNPDQQVGVYEAYGARTTRNLTDLSAQSFIDCSRYNQACKSGTPGLAMDDDVEVETERDYPYKGIAETCTTDPAKTAVEIPYYYVLTNQSEASILVNLLRDGPLAARVSASSYGFKSYKSGVYFDPDCPQTEDKLDHAVLIVGYGTDSILGDYWILVSV